MIVFDAVGGCLLLENPGGDDWPAAFDEAQEPRSAIETFDHGGAIGRHQIRSAVQFHRIGRAEGDDLRRVWRAMAKGAVQHCGTAPRGADLRVLTRSQPRRFRWSRFQALLATLRSLPLIIRLAQ